MTMRNLLGYGRHRPDITWPNGARVAISLVVNFEEGAERAVENGDDRTEAFSEIQITDLGEKRNLVQEQIFDYGMRVGIWRFLDALGEKGMPATFMMCAQAAERALQPARAVAEAGHEIALHGMRWISHAELYDTPEAERDAIADARKRLQEITGQQPVGFMCRGSQNIWTRDLLGELGFLYDSNALDDDLPYWSAGDDGAPMLVLPYGFDTNDMKFFHQNGFVVPDDFSAYVGKAIDVLVEEAERGRSSMLTIGLHLRIAGRPARFSAVQAILDKLEALGDKVWISRRADIAAAFIERHGDIGPDGVSAPK